MARFAGAFARQPPAADCKEKRGALRTVKQSSLALNAWVEGADAI